MTAGGSAPPSFANADDVADAIIAKAGKRIVLGLPLGLGKANHIVNALFARAVADPSIRLKIFTALTLEAPQARRDLERRFIEPLNARLFAGYPALDYAAAVRSGTLPANIEVNEFFFLAGRWLGVPLAQQHYISANYTHALRYLLELGVNVIAQLVARRDGRFSLSCNPDLTCDLLAARRDGRANFVFAGEVNNNLPFMPGDAEVAAGAFDLLLEGPGSDFPLFAPPREPIPLADYAVALHAARTVVDGGTLQIGIGSLGDAVAKALVLRHTAGDEYRALLARLPGAHTAPHLHETGAFARGLYGCTELFVEGLLDLHEAGILTREVDGALLHAAFFLGSRTFYRKLREMPEAQAARFRMTAVSYVNELYGDEATKRRARVNARFINDAMMATLLGGVVSDGLGNGEIVSGVGGQYNFVAQAFALDDARAILALRASRAGKRGATSNILWNYPHVTIPRHLRDIVITEYGIADLRGKSDRDVIAAMLAIADSRFQDELLRRAKDAGKIERGFALPSAACDNTPEAIARALEPSRDRGLLPSFPFGTDFTATEERLLGALQMLKTASPARLAATVLRGLGSPANQACLARMGLDRPSTLSDRLSALLVRGALHVPD
jgi:acyl-CoA hydrolase